MRPHDLLDAHVHVWSGDLIAYPYAPHDRVPEPREPFPAERLQLAMDAAGVEQALLIQPRLLGYDHAYLIDAAELLGPRARVMPLINPVRPSGVREMTALAAQPAVAGFRVIALDSVRARSLIDPAAQPLWKAMGDRQLPLGVLTTPDYLPVIGELIRRHPELVVVLDHFGGVRAETVSEHLTDLAGNSNTFVKVSALGHLSDEHHPYRDLHPLTRQVVAAFGPERCIWGSDWPHVYQFGKYENSFEALDTALSGLTARELSQIFAENARSVFGFPRTGSGYDSAS